MAEVVGQQQHIDADLLGAAGVVKQFGDTAVRGQTDSQPKRC
jgi:hypothetical protein